MFTVNLFAVYQFTGRLHISIVCVVYAITCIGLDITWQLNSIAISVCLLLLAVGCVKVNMNTIMAPQTEQSLILREDNLAACLLIHNKLTYKLDISRSRLSVIGYWLTFVANTERFESASTYKQQKCIFVPKYLLSIADNRCLSRILIWCQQ